MTPQSTEAIALADRIERALWLNVTDPAELKLSSLHPTLTREQQQVIVDALRAYTISPQVDRDALAKTIIGPHFPVPNGSKFTLEQLRDVQWQQADNQERNSALNAADAIASLLAGGGSKTSIVNPEPLGAEFSKPLYDNLQKLYARDDATPQAVP